MNFKNFVLRMPVLQNNRCFRLPDFNMVYVKLARRTILLGYASLEFGPLPPPKDVVIEDFPKF